MEHNLIKSMVKTREVIAWVAVLVLVILLARKDVEIVEVTLPVRENTKIITNPAPIADGQSKVITNFETVKIKNPLNDSLVKAYLAQKDSLSRLNNFIDATRQRDYVGLLEDSLQTITVETRVNGFMREQVIRYKTKEQKIQVEVPNPTRLYLGGVLTMPTELGQTPTLGVQGSLIFRKNQFSIQYDPFTESVTAGYGLRIF